MNLCGAANHEWVALRSQSQIGHLANKRAAKAAERSFRLFWAALGLCCCGGKPFLADSSFGEAFRG
jgi:hypothetical protein